MDTPALQIDQTLRTQVVDGLLQKLNEHYIFPDVAAAMEEAIRRRAGNGEYETIDDGKVLADTLQAHLREVSHDKHLCVFFSPEPQPLRTSFEPTSEEREQFRLWGNARNFGFEKVERLAGNVGYLDFRMFFAVDVPGAAETAIAAMSFLAHTSPLIVDLRRNGGGDPHMVQLMTSYLFDGPVHINSMYWRARDETHQFWTLPYIPGKRDGEKPVYVLTSSDTFSGAEEFTYNLKHMKRATIIGETTGGGAHPGGGIPIDEHFAVGVPTGRPINPITGTNWEGTGVIPDIAVPQEDALRVAHIAALKQVLERIGDDSARPLRELAEEARAALADLEQAPQG